MLNYAHGADITKYISKAINMVGGIPELAAIAGVSERAVYAWKNGERYPSRTNLARLCQYFEQLDTEAVPAVGTEVAQGVQEPVKAFGGAAFHRRKFPAGAKTGGIITAQGRPAGTLSACPFRAFSLTRGKVCVPHSLGAALARAGYWCRPCFRVRAPQAPLKRRMCPDILFRWTGCRGSAARWRGCA